MDLVNENKKLRETLIRIKYLNKNKALEDAQDIASKTLDTLDFPDYPKKEEHEGNDRSRIQN